MIKHLIMEIGLQWGIFMIIPLLVYLIFFRTKINFTDFFGLIKPIKADSRLFIKLGIVFILYILLGIYWAKKYKIRFEKDNRIISFKETGFSIQTILTLLLESVVRTALLEELVFRAFLINTFSHIFGFTFANNIQAIIFAGIHILGMLNMKIIDIIVGTSIIYMISIYFGKLTLASGGSIVYSTVFHGLANILTGIGFIIYTSKQKSKV